MSLLPSKTVSGSGQIFLSTWLCLAKGPQSLSQAQIRAGTALARSWVSFVERDGLAVLISCWVRICPPAQGAVLGDRVIRQEGFMKLVWKPGTQPKY